MSSLLSQSTRIRSRSDLGRRALSSFSANPRFFSALFPWNGTTACSVSPSNTSFAVFPIGVRGMATGSRGSRGHGWLTKYREGRGGRHLQGEYWDAPSLEQKMEWNEGVFELNKNMAGDAVNGVYLEVQLHESKKQAQPKDEKHSDDDKIEVEETSVASEDSSSEDTALSERTLVTADDPTNTSASTSKIPTFRLELELATAALPTTCNHCVQLIENKVYQDSLLDRLEKNVGWCGGNVFLGDEGVENDSISVKGDRLCLYHVPGTLTYFSPRVDEVDVRYMVLTHEAPQLDGRHVPIGRLTQSSLDTLVEHTSNIFTQRGRPTAVDIVVVDCGILGDVNTSRSTAETEVA